MFTGIIEETGTVTSLAPTGQGSAVLTVRAGAVLDGLPEGGSLAVNGVCLTQASPEASTPLAEASPDPASPSAAASAAPPAREFRAHVMGETLARTTIGALTPGAVVNLERCPRAGDRFDGHIVQGHVDGTGIVLARVDEGDWVRLRVSVPARLALFTAEKGSIALDGISLTLTAVSPARPHTATSAEAAGHWVEVGLIPATLEATRMGTVSPGDPVNIEVDVMAKYAARLAEFAEAASAGGAPAEPAPGASPTGGAAPTEAAAAPTASTREGDRS
ncbi:riboflavin synthase [Brevibacterium album]|uniref:riboflavin synthase n=1 Tax=Brevibacterium album TaxID=417948 RepID=UPI00041E406A|nr:riboflavin synthase [Brevibacterium album]